MKDMAPMRRILCPLLVATQSLGSVPADAPKSKNAKVTFVFQHELSNVPGEEHQWRACRIRPGSSGQIVDINVERGGDLL